MCAEKRKTLGAAIDEVVAALEPLDQADRVTAIRAACEHLGVSALSTGLSPTNVSADLVPSSHVGKPSEFPQSPQDIRSLREKKNPRTAIEMACIVAYYLESLAPLEDRKSEVTATDLEKYFKQGGQRLPKRIAQVLIDAKAAGYLDSAGKGKYRLNPVGHNLVVHTLPRASK